MTDSGRDRAIEAAGRQILRDAGYEPRDDRPIGTAWLAAGESILAAAVPVLLNDLADSIEREAERAVDAAWLVRAAAAGWGEA